MKVRVTVPRRFTDEMAGALERDLSDGATVLDLLRSMGVHPDEVLVISGTVPIPVDHVLHDGDDLELLSIASGG